MGAVTDSLPNTPGWSIIAVLVALIFGPMAIFSRESSEKLWILGRFVSWLRTRQERSIDHERALEEATVRHLKGRIRLLDTQLGEMRADFDEERRDARKREDNIRSDFRAAQEYIIYATGWAHHVLSEHARHGWHPPLPPLLSFDDWQDKNRKRGAD